MLKEEYRQMSETYRLNILLTIVGGFLDAYTYISRGNVFANAQTGNIVLLALNLAERNITKAISYLVPILAFVFGVIISEITKTKFKQNSNIHWRQVIIAVEVIVLIIVSFIPQGDMNLIANVGVAFVCSLQYDSFTKFTTTVCTGNLRVATEQLVLFEHTKDIKAKTKSLQYCGIILSFGVGAVLGTILTKVFIGKAVLFSCAILAIVFVMMFREKQ